MGKNNVERRQDHEILRNGVGYYDFTHDLLDVTGPSAAAFLDTMFVNSMSKAKPGDAVYTTMLNPEGIIIDDIIVFRKEEDRYWITTLYVEEMIQWFDANSSGYDVQYKDITSSTIMYAVQGPKSAQVLNDFLSENIDDLKVFTIKDNKIDNVDVKIARCGFTGELGYEIYFAPEHRGLVESKLNNSGKPFGIKETSTDVILSSIPTEKGYIIMRDVAGTNPLEAGLGWTVDWSKDFIGKEALEKVVRQGAARSLVGFTVGDDGAGIEEGDQVIVSGQTAGRVTNCTYGYTVEQNIGYALIDNSIAKVGDKATIVSGSNKIEADLTNRIFYDAADERRTAKVSV